MARSQAIESGAPPVDTRGLVALHMSPAFLDFSRADVGLRAGAVVLVALPPFWRN